MIYDLSNIVDAQKAKDKFKRLLGEKKTIRLSQKRSRRGLSQNNYLHLILSWFCLETGYSMFTTKQILFKQHVNGKIFVINETGTMGERKSLRSSADLNTKEMTDAIDNFRRWSSDEGGIYLPEPNEQDFLNEIEKRLSWQSYV